MTLLTERLSLRGWRESDLTFLQKMRNDVELQARLLSTAKGSSVSDVQRWVTERSEGLDSFFYVVEKADNEDPIGYIQCSREPGSTDGFRFGICLDNEHQSNGYGSELMRWLSEFLKGSYSANKIILFVEKTNRPAIACYKKNSFREVGVLQRHVKVLDDWCDVLVMEKLLLDETSPN
jgi:RimJ/RimL family protein N-acetyltransferase